MLKKQKSTSSNFEILKFLFFSSIFLSSSFFTIISESKAGLEFQWDQSSGIKQLKWFQKDNRPRFRNNIFLFLRPRDRATGLLKINLTLPKKYQKISLKEENISLCKVRIGGYETRTKCLEDVPADIEIKDDKSSLDIYPYKPIPMNKENYAIVLKVINPKRSGLYQFHSFGQPTGESVSTYLGSWTKVLD